LNHAVPARPALLARSAGLAGAATLTSRILGLVRDQVLATLFGAGNDMDAFLVAFRIPNLARDLFAEGAMSAAFVPAFSRQLTLGGKTEAWHLANNALNTLLLLTAAVVGLGLLFAGPLVTAYAGDYAAVPGKLALTIRLTRVMLPFLTLVTVAALLMGMLNSLDHYFVPALAPAVFNVATILCVLALAPAMASVGEPAIMAVAIGALVGGIGLVALQRRPLWREGFRYRPVLDLLDHQLQRVLLLMGPGTLGLAATQVNLFVNTLLATSQGTGAVSWLTYAFRVMYLPIGLFGVSIATAILPAAARYAALDDAKAVRETVSRGMTLMLMLNIPATFGLLALATPIVRLLFERGRFLPSDTASTAAALQCYAIGLVGYSATRIASPVFYALGRSRVPVAVSTASMAINVVAAVLLVRAAGFRGLALATSLAALANGGVLVMLLRKNLHGFDGRRLAVATVKVFAASVVMACVAAEVARRLSGMAPEARVMMQTAHVAAAIGTGMAALMATAKLLRISEFDEALAVAREWVRKLLSD
jgi:putative peptidoglycan lipid II flippase